MRRRSLGLAVVLASGLALGGPMSALAVSAQSYTFTDLLKNLVLDFEAQGTNMVVPLTFAYPDPAHGSIEVHGPVECQDSFGTLFCSQAISYVPDPDFVGTDVWQYTAHDPLNGGDAFGVVSVTYVDDVTAPTGNLQLNGASGESGAGWANSAALLAEVAATDDFAGVSKVRLANAASNGVLLRPRTFDYPSTLNPTVPWSLGTGRATTGTTFPPTFPSGQYTVYAQWADAVGNWSGVKSASIKVDSIPPKLPAIAYGAGSKRFAPGVPVHVTFPATDAGGSGVELYQVQWSINGGAFADTGFDASGGTSDLMLLPANTYRLRARARDLAGTWTPYATTQAFKPVEVDESSGSIAYAGSWRDAGSSKMTTANGATATLTFTGREASWATMRGPNMGKANVYLDGTFVKTVDLYKSSPESSFEAYRATFTSVGTHKIMVRALGTAGRPEVHIDWFFVAK